MGLMDEDLKPFQQRGVSLDAKEKVAKTLIGKRVEEFSYPARAETFVVDSVTKTKYIVCLNVTRVRENPKLAYEGRPKKTYMDFDSVKVVG